MRTLLTVSSALLLLSCGPKPLSTGPYSAWLMLERWHRSDPANEYTMTGIATFHRDDRLPRYLAIDANCSVAYGNWNETPWRPPTYGKITQQIADRAEVTWADDSGGAGIDWPSGQLQWDTGDTLKVTAAGGELPGFTLEATVPAQVMLTSHDLGALKANQLHLSRSTPLELRWDPTQGEVFLLSVQWLPKDTMLKQRYLACTWPASTGSAAIPTTVLEHLRTSSSGVNTNIYFGGVVKQTLALEGVDLTAFTFKNEVARVQVDE